MLSILTLKGIIHEFRVVEDFILVHLDLFDLGVIFMIIAM
jgi:hypothetical protein